MIYGGPVDAMQNCESEATYGLLELNPGQWKVIQIKKYGNNLL